MARVLRSFQRVSGMLVLLSLIGCAIASQPAGSAPPASQQTAAPTSAVTPGPIQEPEDMPSAPPPATPGPAASEPAEPSPDGEPSPVTEPSPGSEPSPSATGSYLGTEVVLFEDDFERDGSGWTQGDMMGASLYYADGRYNVIDASDGTLMGSRALDHPLQVLRFAADFELHAESVGTIGVACDLIVGAVTTEGSYLVTRTEAGEQVVIVEVTDAPLTGTGPGSAFTLMIECAIHEDGVIEVYFSRDGRLLLHVETSAPIDAFAQVGIYPDGTEQESMIAYVETATAWERGAAPLGDPSVVVQSFYDWWVESNGAGDYQERPELAPDFAEEIAAAGPYPFDLFTCAQEVPTQVSAGAATIEGDSARVSLRETFGQPPNDYSSTYPVVLVLNPSGWQITEVHCLG